MEVTGIELEVTGTGVKMGQRMTFCPGLDVTIHISGFCYLIVYMYYLDKEIES